MMMYKEQAPVSSIHTPKQSLDDFPLPPGTPRLSSYNSIAQDDSVPEFNKNFRFPKTDPETNLDDDLDDPEQTFKRLRNEVEILAARLAHDFTNLDSPVTPEVPVKNHQKSYNWRYSSRSVQARPKTSYDYVETPRFPFNDFAGWDLKHEGDERNTTERNNENSVLPHSSTRMRASSLHTSRPHRRMRENPEFIIPVHVRKYITAQERARVDEERAAAIEREKVLNQTRQAVLHISEAGFDFGFKEVEKYDQEPKRVSDLKGKTLSDKNISVESNENTTKTTVITISPRKRHMILTPPTSQSSPTMIWPNSTESYQWPGWGHSDSGIALASPPVSPKSAPPPITTFPDLPEPLRVNHSSKPVSSLSEDRNFTKHSARELSCWSVSPELNQRLNSKIQILEDDEHKKRRGFWGRMKKSIFMKKKTNSAKKEYTYSPHQK